MTQAIDGLIAPEGVYLPVLSYLLPPPPPLLSSLASATLQGTAASASPITTASASAVSANASSQGAPSTGSQPGPAPASSTAAGTSPLAASTGAAANGAEGGGFGVLNGDADLPKTALQHISMQAPSAWSHVPIPPTCRISVASIRYPAGSSVGGSQARRDRQQSSYMSASEVMESSNGSETSLGDGDMGMGGSGTLDPGAQVYIGPVLESTLASQGIDGPASHVTGGPGGLPGMSALQLLAHLGGGAPPVSMTASLTATSPLAASAANAGKNLLKPKNNIKQTSSSFVQRLSNHTDYAKLFGLRSDGNTLERFAFVSRGRILYWLGETANGWIKDPLARLTFANTITSHDINQLTRSPNRIDVAICFSTSDIIWFEAMSSRYSRLNKAGCVNDSPVTNVRWVPGSETLLLTSHFDGTCTIFDVSREDSASGTWAPIRGLTLKQGSVDSGDKDTDGEVQEVLLESQRQDFSQRSSTSDSVHTLSSTATSTSKPAMGAESTWRPAIKSWDPTSRILVTRPSALEGASEGPASKKTWAKMNPVAHWRVARSSAITDMAFSPDHTKLATVSTDGLLRIINLLTESLEGSFESYYGALNKVVFSPDAKFILTAGCDDLISVWTSDGRLLSRCPGHSSFVTGLAFDPWRWKVEDKTYRFGSVGEDGRLFLWDFSSAALVRPKTPHSASFQRRSNQDASANSLLQEQQQRRYSGSKRASMTADRAEQGSTSAAYLRAPPRGEVAELQPVASYQLGGIGVGEQGQSGGIPVSGSSANATSVSPGTTSGAQPAAGSTAPSSAPTASTSAAVNNVEVGSPNDLLVDVRFRPDGILIMHKSGALRFLQRPRHRAASRSVAANVGAKVQRAAVR